MLSFLSEHLFFGIVTIGAAAAMVAGIFFAMLDCFLHRNDRNDWGR